MEPMYKTPKNLDECAKIAWCFECIYNDLKEESILDMCPKNKEFKEIHSHQDSIFFLEK